MALSSFVKASILTVILFSVSFFCWELYVWKKEVEQPNERPMQITTPVPVPPEPVETEMTARRIQDLARNLDILDKTRYN